MENKKQIDRIAYIVRALPDSSGEKAREIWASFDREAAMEHMTACTELVSDVEKRGRDLASRMNPLDRLILREYPFGLYLPEDKK